MMTSPQLWCMCHAPGLLGCWYTGPCVHGYTGPCVHGCTGPCVHWCTGPCAHHVHKAVYTMCTRPCTPCAQVPVYTGAQVRVHGCTGTGVHGHVHRYLLTCHPCAQHHLHMSPLTHHLAYTCITQIGVGHARFFHYSPTFGQNLTHFRTNTC